MAVIDVFECTVSINRSDAQEYDDDSNNASEDTTQNVVTKYIEAISGANFRVHFNVKPNYDFNCDLLVWDIRLDGKRVSGAVIEKHYYSRQFGYNQIQEGVRSSEGGTWILKKYKFGDLEITDAPAHTLPVLSENTIKGLGNITIEVWRQEYLGESTTSHGMMHGDISNGPISEKALKGRALTLSATLGEAVASRAPRYISGRNLDDDAVATFHFKYRSKRSLQAELIIPRSPSPVPLEERPVEELTPQEMRELLRKQRETALVQEEKRKVKRERPQSMQLYGPSRSYKVARNEDGIEVVNLADDDDQDINTKSPASSPSGGVPAALVANLGGIVDLEDFEPKDSSPS